MKQRRDYSFAEVRASLPKAKNASDSPWTRWVLRPLSMPTAWLALRLGIGANAVSYAGAVACLAGAVLLVVGLPWAVWAGFACFFVFGVLDCADGNVARTVKKGSIWGEWVDAMGGYVAYTTILLGSGVVAESISRGALPGLAGLVLPWAGGWAAVGGLAAASNIFMRLLYQGFRAIKPDPGKTEVGGEKAFSENIGITGALLPLLGIGYATGYIAWVVLAYAVVYSGGALLVTLKLVRKVKAEIRSGS
jgi:phosphatidylglycerophosphate synthase